VSTAWYYDNLAPVPAGEAPSLVEIERVYGLYFERFDERDWARLDQIYRALPGAYREAQTPMWFGSDEENPPFLWASVEPPGLQVCGVLPPEDWVAWHSAFISALDESSLPFRPYIQGAGRV